MHFQAQRVFGTVRLRIFFRKQSFSVVEVGIPLFQAQRDSLSYFRQNFLKPVQTDGNVNETD